MTVLFQSLIGYNMHVIISESRVYSDLRLSPILGHNSAFLNEITSEDGHLNGRLTKGDL